MAIAIETEMVTMEGVTLTSIHVRRQIGPKTPIVRPETTAMLPPSSAHLARWRSGQARCAYYCQADNVQCGQ
ncbi:MAG: hypothetical protein U0X20_11335 [Caldilineaceae bacterium]